MGSDWKVGERRRALDWKVVLNGKGRAGEHWRRMGWKG